MASSSPSKFTNGLNMVSPTRSPQLPEILDGHARQGPEVENKKHAFAKFSHANVMTAAPDSIYDEEDNGEEDSNEDVEGFVFLKDETSDYDDVDSDVCLYNFDYDSDAPSDACWPEPLRLRHKPAVYQDLAATSPYGEDFEYKVTRAGDGIVAGRRGMAALCLESHISATVLGADANNKNGPPGKWPTALKTSGLPTSKHHQRVKKQQQRLQTGESSSSKESAPTTIREKTLRGVLKRMDEQSLGLDDSVAHWEAVMEREMAQMELEMELERQSKEHGDGEDQVPLIPTQPDEEVVPSACVSLRRAWDAAMEKMDCEDGSSGTRAPAPAQSSRWSGRRSSRNSRKSSRSSSRSGSRSPAPGNKRRIT